MKNLYKIVPLFLVALFVFSSCTNTLEDNNEQNNQPEKQIVEVQESAADMESTMNEQFGSRYGTDLKCDLLKGETSRRDCDIQMNDMIGMMLESEITSSFDISRCKELPSEIAEECKMRVNESGIKGPVSSEEIAIFEEATQGSFPEPGEEEMDIDRMFPVYDKNECAALKTPGYKEYCENQINQVLEQNKIQEIVSSGDSKRCSELTTEESQTECKMVIGVEENIDVPMPDVPVVSPPDMPIEAPLTDDLSEEITEPETEA